MSDDIDNAMQDEGLVQSSRSSLGRLIEILQYDNQLRGAFRFNLFTNEAEHAQDNILLSPTARHGTIISDMDITCLRTYITKKYDISPSKNNIEDALIDVVMNCKYHPIKQYLESMKWDGVERLDTWLHNIVGCPLNAYTSAVGRKLLVAGVKRIYQPGCYYAQLVVLEGRQRIFKSRLVKEIGGPWYASLHLKTHDTKTVVEEMRGKWVLEIEELAGFSKQDTEYMKAFVSRQHDRVRLSYARKAEDYPRQSIMIATMNPDVGENKYLVDQTGNVRYWPIPCAENRKIKIDEFIEIRDQLFAEAMVRYQQGEKLWLDTDEEEKLAEQEQDNRLSIDPWFPLIQKWLDEKAANPLFKTTTIEIATDALSIPDERINSGVTRRVGKALALAGWQRKRETVGTIRQWFYEPPAKIQGEVQWEE